MKLPRSMFARLMSIWLLGLSSVLAISFWLVLGERDRGRQDALHEGLARELLTAVELIDDRPAGERNGWPGDSGRRRLRFLAGPLPAGSHPLPSQHPFARVLADTLPGREARLAMGPAAEGHRLPQFFVELRLRDGSPITVRLPPSLMLPHPAPPRPGRILLGLGALALGVLILSWFAVRMTTRPLSRLVAAARNLGENPDCAPLATDGAAEVRQACESFNQMQARLREHIHERTRILAAISHDLQTPITRLQLRAEQIEAPGLREKFQRDLDAMQHMVREGLAFARSLDATRSIQAVDLDALVSLLADEAADLGWRVDVCGQIGTPVQAHPDALRRALQNLIDNGVKFGGRVEIALTRERAQAQILIRDHGPGLSEEECEKVFEPFYRVESSRNSDSGGTGLGLAIARNLLRAQGGEIELANAAGGGLTACVRLALSPRRPENGQW